MGYDKAYLDDYDVSVAVGMAMRTKMTKKDKKNLIQLEQEWSRLKNYVKSLHNYIAEESPFLDHGEPK